MDFSFFSSSLFTRLIFSSGKRNISGKCTAFFTREVRGEFAITYALIAGTVFHAFWGTILCALSASISAGISFLMGRYFLHDAIRPKLEKNPYIRKYFFSGEKRNLLFLLFLTRTIPVFPFNLQNYAYGITDISFSLYFIASFLFMIPGTAMYTVAFAGLTEKKNPMLYFGISLGILVLLLLASFLFKKKNVVEKDSVKESSVNDIKENSV